MTNKVVCTLFVCHFFPWQHYLSRFFGYNLSSLFRAPLWDSAKL